VYFTGFWTRRATANGDPLLGSDRELATEATADVGGDDPDLRLGDTGRRGQGEADDVRDLGRAPDGDLLAGRVDHDRARLHEGRDEALLVDLPFDHDAIGARLLDRLVDVAARAGLRRVEPPERALVGFQVGVCEHRVLRGLLEVEDGGQLVELHVDELGGVARLGRGARDDDGHHLTGEGDTVDGHRGMCGGLLVGGDRPGVDHHALRVGDVLAGDDRDHIGGVPRGAGVDARDRGVGVGAAHHRQVEHARESQVVGPPGAAGEEALVLLAAAVLADLGRGGRFGGGSHWTPAFSPECSAAYRTLLTMLW
jgi:hypothetical protein